MKILYLGDAVHPARYLSETLTHLDHEVIHVPMSSKLPELDGHYDVIIISDYPAKKIDEAASTFIAQLVEQGSRLIMLGGWDSFNGQGTGYVGHPLADLLPVQMQNEDDRVNAPQGLIMSADPSFQSDLALDWQKPPVICGYNAFETKAGAGQQVLLWIRPIQSDGTTIALLEPLPFLVKGAHGSGTVLACATDLAPHWCGGLIDWGSNRLELNEVEVGSMYPTFLQLLLEA